MLMQIMCLCWLDPCHRDVNIWLQESFICFSSGGHYYFFISTFIGEEFLIYRGYLNIKKKKKKKEASPKWTKDQTVEH